MPPRKEDIKGKRPAYVVERDEAGGPIQKYLVWLCVALCVVLAVNSISVARNSGSNGPWTADPRVWRCLLPSRKSLLIPKGMHGPGVDVDISQSYSD